MIWTSRNQVQNCTPGTDVPHLAASSTPEEWESFGHDLFKHKRYPQAMHCFARALLPRMVAICEAFHLREVARAKVGVAPRKAQQDAFLTAADAFMASGNDAPPGKDKLQYYRNAADCYARAQEDRKAADAYLDAREYDLAARRFQKIGLFDKILEVLHEHSVNISSESLEELYTMCRLFYCSKRGVNRWAYLMTAYMLRHLTNISVLDHVCRCFRPLKKNWHSLRATNLILPGLHYWKITEGIWKQLSFICQRTGRSTQSETS